MGGAGQLASSPWPSPVHHSTLSLTTRFWLHPELHPIHDDQYLTLEGGALVEATFQGTASDDYRPGTQTVPDKFTPALAQVKQIGLAEDWEGVVRLGVGLEHRAGFRVLELRDPARVVVDFAT
jgi:hypothetical protein